MTEETVVTKRWMLFNVGCIECNVTSNVVGFFGTKIEAEAAGKLCDKHLDWRENGQNSFEVFDLTAAQSEEYAAILKGGALGD